MAVKNILTTPSIPPEIVGEIREFHKRTKFPKNPLFGNMADKLDLFAYAAGRVPNATIADVYDLIDQITGDGND